MAEKKAAKETAPEATSKKRPNYHRRLSVSATPNRGERLKPILHVLLEENITIAQLAEKCEITRQGMNLRFTKDDCNLTDMEKMAEVLGYDFNWTFTKKK